MILKKTFFLIIAVIIVLFISVMIFNNAEEKQNIVVEEKEVNKEIKEEKSNMTEVLFLSGLHAGSKNNQKILWENNECFVPISLLESILGGERNDVKVIYDESENIIKAYYNVVNYEEENTFLIIDVEKGIMKGKAMDGVRLEDEKMKVTPIIQEDTILLPLKCILNRIRSWDSAVYYEEELGIIRIKLQDFELDFLNDFPYNVVGNYTSNSVVSYHQAINISAQGIIYEKDGKYGLVSYNVEEYYEDNSIPKGNYLGYTIELEAEYDEIEFIPYDYNVYVLHKDNKSIIYTIEDKTLSEEYDLVQKIENGDQHYKVKKNGKYGVYGISEVIYEDIWYEQGKTTGTTVQYTQRGIYGSLNGEKVLIKELAPGILCVD